MGQALWIWQWIFQGGGLLTLMWTWWTFARAHNLTLVLRCLGLWILLWSGLVTSGFLILGSVQSLDWQTSAPTSRPLLSCDLDSGRLARLSWWDCLGGVLDFFRNFACETKGRKRSVVVRPRLAGLLVWWWCLIWCHACRVGEAAQPGPPEAGVWTLGLCNPGGLPGKAMMFRDSPVDTWLVTESHLTVSGNRGFQAALRSFNSKYKWLVSGHPVQPRGVTSDIDVFSGVAVLSSCPSRRLCHSWEPTLYASGRLVAAATYTHGVWVQGVTVYCPPKGATHRFADRTANLLLWNALDRVLHQSGPRYIAGDLNHNLSHLEAVQAIRQAGFVEAQDLRCQLTGILPEPTCRSVTRRDCVFLSPELAKLFVNCRLSYEDWPDHAAMILEFRGMPNSITRFPWPQPLPVPWKEVGFRTGTAGVDFASGNCDDLYRQFWQQIESDAAKQLGSLGELSGKRWRGRGLRLAPVTQTTQVPPLKPPRAGDKAPAFLGSAIQHVHWHRQRRRLQSYVRLVAAEGGSKHAEHRKALWKSILRAKGFAPDFSTWWNLQDHGIGLPECISGVPVHHSEAVALLAGFDVLLDKLEKVLNSSSKHAQRLKGAGTLSSLYRAVKRDAPAQVDMLETGRAARITDVFPEDLSISLDPPMPWDPQSPFLISTREVMPLVVTEDRLWLDSLNNIEVGSMVRQVTRLGSLPDLFQAFESHWNGLWNKVPSIPESQWHQILDFAKRVIRPVQSEACPMTLESVRATVLTKSKRSATGLDGVCRSDVLALCDSELNSVVSMFERAHCTGAWPQQTVNGLVRSLAKVDDPVNVAQYRPVTVYSLFYRTWGSLQSRHWLRALVATLDPFICGNRPHSSAADLWLFCVASS